jgi:hypothetical protein
VAVNARAALKLELYVVVEVSDPQLSHGDMIARYRRKTQPANAVVERHDYW